jgi:type III restriction enzyme
MSTADRQNESCSAAELRRSSKPIFYVSGCEKTLADEQKEFFNEINDDVGEFAGARHIISNSADFRSPVNLAIADARPERQFIRDLCNRGNASKLSCWLKNTPVGFYTIQYAWKKGEHPKRGEFSPDFFIKQGDRIYVVEIKSNDEVDDPAPENIKKSEYGIDHFDRLNKWLEKKKIKTRYQFNMLSPKSYNVFFQKLRDEELPGFRSDLDVAIMKAAKTLGQLLASTRS